jgi:hypothetical protein
LSYRSGTITSDALVDHALRLLVLLGLLLLLLLLTLLVRLARLLQGLLPVILLGFGDGLSTFSAGLIGELMQAELFGGIASLLGERVESIGHFVVSLALRRILDLRLFSGVLPQPSDDSG